MGERNKASVNHGVDDISSDGEGWWWCACACGWSQGPFLGIEDATDAIVEHVTSDG